MVAASGPGPLHGVSVLEMAGIGPAPFAAMMLADMGADVVRVERKGPRPRAGSGSADVLQRGRRSITLDLKAPGAAEVVLRLAARSALLIEGFRPGVMERLGLGPEPCLARNPALVYGRVSGWGQRGPLAQAAGHDINYLALSGALHAMGEPDRPPTPPLNLVADFGGGGLLLGFGLVCALWEATHSGRGQVVDAAMSDGSALLMAMLYGYRAMGRWDGAARGGQFLDGSAPFYASYRCADGRYIAVGAIEPQFFTRLRVVCGLAGDAAFDELADPARWPEQKARLAAVFQTRSRDAWVAAFEGVDACVTPVLTMDEAPQHAHHRARASFAAPGGVAQPAAAPRFSRSGTRPAEAPVPPGAHTDEILGRLGFDAGQRKALREAGAV